MSRYLSRLGPLLVSLLLLTTTSVIAAEPEASGQAQDDYAATIAAFEAELDYQFGTVTLPDDIAVLDLGTDYRYLSPEDARHLLVDGWGNPPDVTTGIIGMILPLTSPFEDAGWGVTLRFRDEGYITDEDAGDIDYDEMLTEMQQAVADDSVEREAQGYGSYSLVGWAQPPYYDAQTHKLHWAKELNFGGYGTNTLNYEVRILGRRGYLEMTAIGGMDQFPTIRDDMVSVLALTNFQDGHTYADFDPDIDEVAGYGLAALVAGGILSKTGLLAKIGVFLFAMKKFLIIAVIALGAGLRRFFGGRKDDRPQIQA
jgi:uncharacterized membrane-anchored protein